MAKVRALDKLQRRAISNVPQEKASIYIPLNSGQGSEVLSTEKQGTFSTLNWSATCRALASELGHSSAEDATHWSPSGAGHWPGQWGSWTQLKEPVQHRAHENSWGARRVVMKVLNACLMEDGLSKHFSYYKKRPIAGSWGQSKDRRLAVRAVSQNASHKRECVCAHMHVHCVVQMDFFQNSLQGCEMDTLLLERFISIQ